MASKHGDGNDAIVPVDSNSTEPMSPVTRADSAIPDTNLFGHLTLWQSVKKWRRVVLYCFAMTSAIMMYGFDYVVVGTVTAMPSFQRDFGERLEEGSDQFILPSLWLGLWNFISPGCAMVGAIAGGHFQDRYGRRSSLALGSLLCAAGVAVCFASEVPDVLQSRRIMFLAGKGFQGGAIGMVMATAQTYMSEILPPNLRGPLLAFFPMFTLLGQLIGAAVIFACLDLQRGYVVAFGTQWIFSAVPMVLAFLIPESPAFLVRKDRIEDAIKSQARLDCPGTDTRRVVEGIRVDIEHERRLASATYRDSFRKGNLRRTMIVMFANMVPQLFGLALLAKASYFVQIVGMKASLSVLVLILGILGGLIGNVASMWTLNKFGRRPLTITSLSAATVLWASMGVAGCFSGPATVW
jgi:MFS family permease